MWWWGIMVKIIMPVIIAALGMIEAITELHTMRKIVFLATSQENKN